MANLSTPELPPLIPLLCLMCCCSRHGWKIMRGRMKGSVKREGESLAELGGAGPQWEWKIKAPLRLPIKPAGIYGIYVVPPY